MSRPKAGTWQVLPAAPVPAPLHFVVSVWTGSQMLIHGMTGTLASARPVTLSYTPATKAWRALAPGPALQTVEGWNNAIWTGTEMLTFGPAGTAAYNPAANTWRPVPPNGFGMVAAVRVWTGRQEIFWGGGCCDEATAEGAAYTPAAGSWQPLPHAPLSARYTTGAWTGTEVIIAGGWTPLTVNGARTEQTLADAAAYNPATRTWRKLPPMPEARSGATAVWDGTEVLFIGGTRAGAAGPSADGVAFNPLTGRWRRLPAMEYGRSGFAAVWTGRQVLVWGGLTGPLADRKTPAHGVAYDPAANQWSALPIAPLRGRDAPTAAWTGRQMIVWGGVAPSAEKTTILTDGAAYQPGGS